MGSGHHGRRRPGAKWTDVQQRRLGGGRGVRHSRSQLAHSEVPLVLAIKLFKGLLEVLEMRFLPRATHSDARRRRQKQ
jgi:hypothetical protein